MHLLRLRWHLPHTQWRFEEPVDKDWTSRPYFDSLVDIRSEHVIIVNYLHASSTKDVRRSYKQGIAYIMSYGQGLFEGDSCVTFWLGISRRHYLFEPLPVLGKSMFLGEVPALLRQVRVP